MYLLNLLQATHHVHEEVFYHISQTAVGHRQEISAAGKNHAGMAGRDLVMTFQSQT